jgi:hypothetical protein
MRFRLCLTDRVGHWRPYKGGVNFINENNPHGEQNASRRTKINNLNNNKPSHHNHLKNKAIRHKNRQQHQSIAEEDPISLKKTAPS